MTAPKRMLDRTDWIKKRNAEGFDWSELVEKMALLVIEYDEKYPSLVIDASAICTDKNMPTRFFLEPESGGTWWATGPGESAHLVEHLWAITMMVSGHKYQSPGPQS